MRVVFDMHENLPKEILTKTWISGPLRRVASRMARAAQVFVTRSMPTVFAETSYAADFPRAREAVVILNYPLLEPLLAIRETKRPTFTIGYIGGISTERGAPAVLDAIAALRGRGKSVECVLVGPVAPEPALLDRIAAAERDGWLTSMGRLPPSDGWRQIARCHVGVAVLQPSPNFVDSYPTKLFEYMALSLPVVISDFPLWRRIVEGAGCGLMVRPDDAGAIADALDQVLTNPQHAADMGRRGRAAVEAQYRWETEFAKLRGLYARLLHA
jgi:glycosyltransferase involved in cell wall biosynthesis